MTDVVKKPRRVIQPMLIISPPHAEEKIKLTAEELLGNSLINKIKNQKPWNFNDLVKQAHELNIKYPTRRGLTTDDLSEVLVDFVKSQQSRRKESMFEKIEARDKQERARIKKLMSEGYSEDQAYKMLDKIERNNNRKSSKKKPKRTSKPKKVISEYRKKLLKALYGGRDSPRVFKRLRKMSRTRSRSRSRSRSKSKSRSRSKSKSRSRSHSHQDKYDFLNKQTVVGLKTYAKARHATGYSKLRKDELIKFILNTINVNTGKLL